MEHAVVLSSLGAVALAVGLWSDLIRRAWASTLMIALGVGVLLGPHGLAWIAPRAWGDEHRILGLVAELTMALVVLGVPIRLPHRYFRQQGRSALILLTLGMVGMGALTAAAAWLVLPVSLTVALLLGAVLAPTDPILAGAVVEGPTARRNIPARLRHLLLAESAANDGLARLFVLAPLLALTASAGWAGAWSDEAVWRGILVAAASGAVVGYGVGRLERVAGRRRWSESGPLLSVLLAATVLLVGVNLLLHGNGVFAAFVAGLALDATRDDLEEREEQVQLAVVQFFQLPVFLLLGALLPWRAWGDLGWSAVLFVVLVLLARRLPVVLLLRRWLPVLRTRGEAAFVGWFGPIGVAALYYGLLARERAHREDVYTVVTLVVVASVLVHGVTAKPMSTALRRADGDG